VQFEKDFLKEEINDTLSTTMINVHLVIQQMRKSVAQSTDFFLKELIEPLELYQKHYQSTNQELIKQASHYWNKINRERAEMLHSKEVYFAQMNALT